MGERKVIVKFMSPACMVNIERVGVICMSVTVALRGAESSWPIQEYVWPSTLTLPTHPTVSYPMVRMNV